MTSSKLSKSLSKVVFLYARSLAIQMRNKVIFLHEHSMVVSVVQQMAVLCSFGGIHPFICGGQYFSGGQYFGLGKADSVFGSDFSEEPKSLMRSVGQSSWRWRGWSPHWGQIIMPRNVAVDWQIIMILRFLFHNIAKGTVF